jgi:hypothetical protein
MRPSCKPIGWIATAVLALSGASSAGPVFTDVTVSAGVSYQQHAPQPLGSCIFSGYFCEPERMSGGAAVADVDGDGRPDLYVTRLDAPDLLFRNLGDGTFEDFTFEAGLSGVNLQTNGAGFADIDNDGDPDLYLTVIGEFGDGPNNRNYLFLNDGTGQFSEVATVRGAAVSSTENHRLYSIAFGDYDRNGWVDIHMNEWLPSAGAHSRLLRNLGPGSPGHFEDRTIDAGVLLADCDAFASTFADLDGDGWQDLAIAADFGTSRLYWNDGDGTFTEGGMAAGVATDENGMGSTIGDYDGDGDLDWFVTSIFDAEFTCDETPCGWSYTGNRLYRNEGGRSFTDATDAVGVRDGSWGWGAGFFDYDNDGDLDLTMVNGVDFPSTEIDLPFVDDPMRFWENDGTGTMTEMAATVGLDDTASGKGLLIFDYDSDGDLDLFIVNNGAAPKLYRNDGGNQKRWLRVDVEGSAATRDGYGAIVTVEPTIGGPVQTREIGVSTHFLGQSELTAHFGLGDGDEFVDRVLVRWPGGKTQGATSVARNRTLLFTQSNCVDGDLDGYCVGADCNDQSVVSHPGAAEQCDGLDNDCDGQTDETCAGTTGAVPDGASVPGPPLRIDRGPGGDLTLTWSPSCSPTATDYHVYEGTLGDFTSHLPALCTTSNTPQAEFTPGAGSTYYLVTPGDTTTEGSHGRRSDTTERPTGPSTCRLQLPTTCPL